MKELKTERRMINKKCPVIRQQTFIQLKIIATDDFTVEPLLSDHTLDQVLWSPEVATYRGFKNLKVPLGIGQ